MAKKKLIKIQEGKTKPKGSPLKTGRTQGGKTKPKGGPK